MLVSIACILIALLWLLIETKDLRINLMPKFPDNSVKLLPAGQRILQLPAGRIIDTSIPYYWTNAEQREDHFILCQSQNCTCKSKCNKSERWIGWKLPDRTLKVFGSTLNLKAQCNIQRAMLLRDLADAQKVRVKHIISAPCKNNQANLFQKWIDKHDFTEANEYEPTIDISVGEKTISINGNYKPGMIKTFVRSN